MILQPGAAIQEYIGNTSNFTRPVPSIDFGANAFVKIMTSVDPNGRPNYLLPSKYILALELSAANARPVKRYIEVEFTGQWANDPAVCISLRKVDSI